MVPKSFGNRSFMQPMGRLSLHSRCLFFSLKFWGGGGRKRKIFFILPLFQQVPNVFPMGFLLSFGGLRLQVGNKLIAYLGHHIYLFDPLIKKALS